MTQRFAIEGDKLKLTSTTAVAPEMDVAADDLPAFLTEDEPDGVAFNGASVP